MEVSHRDYLEVLRAVRAVPGVKKVFIRSGIRYDYVMADRDETFLYELCRYHVSGTLKIAPEHVSDRVLRCMHKPGKAVFLQFAERYRQINDKLQKKQYLIPYFISSHPGSSLDDAVELALFLKDYGFVPDQVQDFYPTPGTLATCMYYTGRDPLTMEEVYVAKNLEEKKMQRALIHYNKPENRKTVIRALQQAGREDLIDVLLGGRGKKHEFDQRTGKIIAAGKRQYQNAAGRPLMLTEEIGEKTEPAGMVCHGDNKVLMKKLLEEGKPEGGIQLIYIDRPSIRAMTTMR